MVRIRLPPAESHANLGPSTPAGLGRLPLPPHGALMPSANFVFATRSARAEPNSRPRRASTAVLVRHFNKPRAAAYLRITVRTGDDTKRLIAAAAKILEQG